MLDSGIHSISMADYQADPCPAPSLSNGCIRRLLDQTPRHAWMAHPRLNPNATPDEPTKGQDFGQALHGMLLEGIDRTCIVNADDWRTNAAKAAREGARESGLIPLLIADHERAILMVEAAATYLKTTPFAHLFAGNGHAKAEQSVIWQDAGVWCKARPDLLADDLHTVIDYKSTGLDGPGEFIRAMAEHGYHTQAEFYRRGIYHLTRDVGRLPRFLFLVQETKPPFMAYFVENSEAMTEVANSRIGRALGLWERCLRTNEWPGYSTDVYQADPPVWVIRDEELAA